MHCTVTQEPLLSPRPRGQGQAELVWRTNKISHPLGSCCQGKLWHEFSLSASPAGHVLRSPGQWGQLRALGWMELGAEPRSSTEQCRLL